MKQPTPGSKAPVPAGVLLVLFRAFISCSSNARSLLPQLVKLTVKRIYSTQPFATQLVILALEEAIQRGDIAEEDVTQEGLERFLGKNGRQFYKLDYEDGAAGQSIVLERKGERVPRSVRSKDGEMEVGMSRGGDEVMSLRWDILSQ